MSSLTSKSCTYLAEMCQTHSVKKMLAVVMLLLIRSKAVQYTFSKLQEHSLLIRSKAPYSILCRSCNGMYCWCS